jgi:hypothetical protein
MDLKGSNTGATLSLNAIGQQDTYLLNKDTEHSFFNYDIKQHTNFSKYHKRVTVHKPTSAGPSWPFGESVKVTLNPTNMGDLLSNMYVHINFPAVDSTSNIADQIGRHIFESVAMRVDELEVDKYHDDWGIIYDELYLDDSEKYTKRYTLNRNGAQGTSMINDAALSRYPSELMIPIPFFFSRKYESDEYSTNLPNRPYFPTCAIHKQKIEFEFKVRPITFFTNNPSTITLDTFDIITEEITVSPEERTFLMTTEQTFITDIAKKHPTEQTIVGDNNIKLQLVPNIPVKTLNWFFRKTVFEDENEDDGGGATIPEKYFENRFNFTSNTSNFTTYNDFFYPVMQSAKIFVNGQDLPNIPTPQANYYKYVVTNNCRLSRPEKNIYTYAFSMNPINVEPSGSLDFSQLNSDRTILDINLTGGLTDAYTLHLYYVGYQTFRFNGGFMSLAY